MNKPNYKDYYVFQLQDNADYRENHGKVREFTNSLAEVMYDQSIHEDERQEKLDAAFADFNRRMGMAFTLVGVISARSLDGVYEIGNVGPESHIKRYPGRSMVSVSVGDLILTPASRIAMVLPVGFAEFNPPAEGMQMAA